MSSGASQNTSSEKLQAGPPSAEVEALGAQAAPPPPTPAAPAAPAAQPKPIAPARKRRRGLTAAIIIVIVLVLLLVWTILSPAVPGLLSAAERQSPSLGRTGTSTVEAGAIEKLQKFYGGNVTWEVIVKKRVGNATAGIPYPVEVIVSKQSENVSNFFEGTSPRLTRVEVNDTSASYSTNFTYFPADATHPYVSGVVSAVFPSPGVYTVTVQGRFTVDQVMVVGFLPADSILFSLYGVRIVVT